MQRIQRHGQDQRPRDQRHKGREDLIAQRRKHEDEAVDRLRAAAGTIIADSPEFKRLLKDVGLTVLAPPPTSKKVTP